MIGTHLFFVGATPSSETTSANSGFVMMIPIAFAVSIDEPPPIATIQSAPEALNASTPACTFSTVGFALISENIAYSIPALSRTSVTFLVTPNLIRSGSEHTKAFEKALALISSATAAIAPLP